MTTLDTELAPVLPVGGQGQRTPKWKKRSTWVTVIWAAALIVIVAVVLYPLL